MNLALNICEWFAILAIMVAFVFSLIKREKKNLLPIQSYIIISLLVNILLKFLELLPQFNPDHRVSGVTINIYSLIEISLLYVFLFKRIAGKRFRIFMIFFYLIYFSICTSLCFGKYKAIFFSNPVLFGLEDLFLAIPCMFYFYEIMKSDLHSDFKTDENFIITCGILFYFSITTPYFLENYNMYVIAPAFLNLFSIFNSIFYGLLFLSFMKAYLCPIPKQEN